MTLQHILYLPTIFFLGFLFGSLITERRHGKETRKLQINIGLPDLVQGTTGKILLFAFLIFLCTFIITHLFPIPYGSKMVQNALGGLQIFDKKPSFSSTEVYNRMASYPIEGLNIYKRFTYTIDIIFPLFFFYFLITLARFVIQRISLSKHLAKAIIVIPFIWLALDFIENAIVFALLTTFPIKNNLLGSILGFLTTTKFVFLFSAILVPVLCFVFARKKFELTKKQNLSSKKIVTI
jgi:hypothetical protein